MNTNPDKTMQTTSGFALMNKYRISDEATSNEYITPSIEEAVSKFLHRYDTAEMEEGDTFTAHVFEGGELRDLCAVVTVTADGKGGVANSDISLR